jgi:ABC-type sulfate/molybdate transport systems ATPase subunit
MLSVHHLVKYVGDVRVVHGVSFEVEPGEVAALLGPADSGMSMVLRLVAGLETPTSGDLVLAGESLHGVPARRRGVGFVNRDHSLFDHMTVSENIAFDLKTVRTRGGGIDETVRELLELTGLAGLERHFPAELSPQQRRRAAIARALALCSRLLVLDEPFADMEDGERRDICGLLRRINGRRGVAILLATQYQEEAMAMADRVVLLNRGRVEQTGTPLQLYHAPASKFVASFIGKVNVIEAYVREGTMFLDGRSLAITDEHLAAYREGDAVLLVRPEDIELTRGERPDGLALQVTQVRSFDDRFEIVLNGGGLELKSELGRDSMERERWTAGERACARLVRLRWYPAHEGFGPVRRRLRALGYIE